MPVSLGTPRLCLCVCAEGGPEGHELTATYCRTTTSSSEDVASTQNVGMRFRSVVKMSLVDNLK